MQITFQYIVDLYWEGTVSQGYLDKVSAPFFMNVQCASFPQIKKQLRKNCQNPWVSISGMTVVPHGWNTANQNTQTHNQPRNVSPQQNPLVDLIQIGLYFWIALNIRSASKFPNQDICNRYQ